MQRLEAYIDSGGETHAANNLTIADNQRPADRQQLPDHAGPGGPNAFVYNGDLTGGSFNITNTPVCTPTPSTWTSQYAARLRRRPLAAEVWRSLHTAPTVTDYAKTRGRDAWTSPVVTTDTRDAAWELDGYDHGSPDASRTERSRATRWGRATTARSFYMWPPDPRYTAGADPTNISTTNPVQDSAGRLDGRLAEAVLPEPERQLRRPRARRSTTTASC